MSLSTIVLVQVAEIGLLLGSQSAPATLQVLTPSDSTHLVRRADLEGDFGVIAQRGRPVATFERRDREWIAAGFLGTDVGASFGDAVAISAGWVAVGEPGAAIEGSTDTGVVHLFERKGMDWSEALRLRNEGAAGLRSLGCVLAMDRGVLAVRAGGSQATVLVLELENGVWVQRARLTPGVPSVAFGEAIAVDDGRVLVGAPDDADFHGAAYVYERGSGEWSTCHALGGGGRAWEGDFGRTVALDGEWAAVGQWGSLPDSGEHGVVLFRREASGWIEIQRIEARDDAGPLRGPREPWFGSGLALSGADLVIGAQLADDLSPLGGAAYHFRLDAPASRWTLESRFPLGTQADLRAVGAWVALDEGQAWITARQVGGGGVVLAYGLAP